MPAQTSGLEMMDEDRSVEDVLDKFVSCHEQTYEEFLSTFTHLLKDLMLLPGEVEQDLCMSMPSYTPSTTWPPAPGIKPQPTVRSAHQQMEEVFGDEVQPFSLNEEFDYDSVVLTPKFTPEELQAIQELSKQRRENVNTDLEAPCDSFTKTS
ncbi:intraflagellar transport-associated protein isoform X2 [Suncus etruscus]|uniref:intraflagellar transport-associated protein isoform X2 n=1 Tax=Suncus etruscus TaxID=109475 RepID=UPI0021101C38|nr:intraflagellar transport-associated protein isoform X2 [Suncus etruscus]